MSILIVWINIPTSSYGENYCACVSQIKSSARQKEYLRDVFDLSLNPIYEVCSKSNENDFLHFQGGLREESGDWGNRKGIKYSYTVELFSIEPFER